MSSHLILTLKEPDWGISPEMFIVKLKERWPDARVGPGKTPGVVLRWSVPIEDYDLLGSFHDDGLTVGLNGPFEGKALFACWYRTLIPPEIPLILMDQGYNTIYPLTAETTPDDITSGRIATEPPDEIP